MQFYTYNFILYSWQINFTVNSSRSNEIRRVRRKSTILPGKVRQDFFNRSVRYGLEDGKTRLTHGQTHVIAHPVQLGEIDAEEEEEEDEEEEEGEEEEEEQGGGYDEE